MQAAWCNAMPRNDAAKITNANKLLPVSSQSLPKFADEDLSIVKRRFCFRFNFSYSTKILILIL